MNGIPVIITRDGQPETIYLSTRRSGETGAAMKAAKKAYREAKLAQGRLMIRIGAVTSQADKLQEGPENSEALLKLARESDALMDELNSAREAVQDAAERLVELSVRECHGEDAKAILDCLADAQIEKLVGVIESGECPADFFPSRATPQNASSTKPAAESPSGPSSPAATRPPILKPGV